MPDENRPYDLFLIYHPDDLPMVRRIAAQLEALGSRCRFDEDDFGDARLDIVALKLDLLRSHVVGIVLSPASAASQLCNELIQVAVNSSKRIVTLILDDDIEVEVHPAVAENAYLFFRDGDALAERVDELRQHLTIDDDTRLHTKLLAAADLWQRRGRRPSQLLPAEQVEEARQWLAKSGEREQKLSPLLVEFIHSSRRQRQPARRRLPRARLALAVLALIALGLVFALLRSGLEANQEARALAAQTQALQTQAYMTEAAATAAKDSALNLVDALAATSVSIGAAVKETAEARALAATQASFASQTAQAAATQLRLTALHEEALNADAARLIVAAKAALDEGDSELALALAWVAKDALDDPKPAYRLLRRATSLADGYALDAESLPRFQPGGMRFAVLADDGALRIYTSDSWQLLAEHKDQGAPITQLAYSPDGQRLVTAGQDGEILMRDGDTGEIIKRVTGHAGAVTALAYSTSGDRFYTAGQEPTMAAWDSQSLQALARYTSDDDALTVDDLLASAEGRVTAWTTTDGAPLTLQWAAESLERISPADERLYRGYDRGGRYAYTGGRSLPAYPGDPHVGALRIWDLGSGGEIARLTDGFNWSLGDLSAPSDELRYLAFHEDLALIGLESSDGGRRAVLVSLPSGQLIKRYESELAAGLVSAAFIDRQTLLSRTRAGRLISWSSADGSLIRDFAGEGILALDFDAAANTIMAIAESGPAWLWRLREDRHLEERALPEALPGTGISPDGQSLLIMTESGLRLESTASGDKLAEYEAEAAWPHGEFFATLAGDRLRLHEWRSGERLHEWRGEWTALEAAQIADDGEWLLAREQGGGLWLLARRNERPLQLDAPGLQAPRRILLSSAGERMLSLQGDGAILWELGSGQALGRYALDAPDLAQLEAAFAPDGSLAFFALLADGKASLTLLSPPETLLSRRTWVGIAGGQLSADGGGLLLRWQDGSRQIIDMASGETIARLPSASQTASHWRYLPERNLAAIATGSALSLWDLPSGELDQRIMHSQAILDFSISDDGQALLIRDAEGAYYLWRLETDDELLRRVEAERNPRQLTCEERLRHLVLPLCA